MTCLRGSVELARDDREVNILHEDLDRGAEIERTRQHGLGKQVSHLARRDIDLGYRRVVLTMSVHGAKRTSRLRTSRSGNDPEAEVKPYDLDSFAFGRYVRVMTCSVLLDLDGTLIDSQPGILASCLAALRALGHEPDETLDIRRFIGPPLEDIMQALLQSYGDGRVGEAVAAYRQHYGESGFLGSEPYPGIGRSLEEMKRAGLRIYLATSKRMTFASRILEHLEFATYFDGIYGSVPGGELDHKPELLAHILSRHDISPSRSLMVGDRRHDISGAHAVGMRGLGVLWGYGSRDELETAGADQLVESTADLARTVLSMIRGKSAR